MYRGVETTAFLGGEGKGGKLRQIVFKVLRMIDLYCSLGTSRKTGDNIVIGKKKRVFELCSTVFQFNFHPVFFVGKFSQRPEELVKYDLKVRVSGDACKNAAHVYNFIGSNNSRLHLQVLSSW